MPEFYKPKVIGPEKKKLAVLQDKLVDPSNDKQHHLNLETRHSFSTQFSTFVDDGRLSTLGDIQSLSDRFKASVLLTASLPTEEGEDDMNLIQAKLSE